MPVTLAIDFGSRFIGLALVRNQDGHDEPLFAGTIAYKPSDLRSKVVDRAQIRRIRRTRKTKHARLRSLEHGLRSIGVPPEAVQSIARFSRRRGYKSLWGEEKDEEKDQDGQEEETLYRFSREVFFEALEAELFRVLPEGLMAQALEVCARVLNRPGDRRLEVRPLRIENRGKSRCAWEGCERVTPRRHNALRDTLSQVVYTTFKAAVEKQPELRQELDGRLDRVAELARRYRNAGGANPAEERKTLLKRIRTELSALKPLAKSAETREADADKAWRYIKANLEDIIKKQTGRNRYCREHSAAYVSHLLEGKPIPFKPTLTERDLVSRQQEVLYAKIWRYIEARLFPLAPEGFDRVVVERVAIDLVAGSRKQREKLGDAALENLYQQGPRLGFGSDLEMLKKEFGGLCAYCGQPNPGLIQREHILPRSIFFFDSYLNLVPACPACNQGRKGASTPGPADLRIHEEAYAAYTAYLDSISKSKPLHLFHTIKKGLLNLMREPDRVWEAEAYLALVAKHFATAVQSQRGPRPLARYLGEKLRQRQGRIPSVAFFSGRHTEAWRRASYPDFDKAADKASGGRINHALDALLLACALPSVAALEARHLRSRDLTAWKQAVQAKAPQPGPMGFPELPKLVKIVPGFEEPLPGNYVSLDLALFNWNRKNTATHQQDPFGWQARSDTPVKRGKAQDLAAALVKIDRDKKGSLEDRQKEVVRLLERLAHPNLRSHLLAGAAGDAPGEQAAEALKGWLRNAVAHSLPRSKFSSHPGDQARKRDLLAFAEGAAPDIPAIVGVRELFPDVRGKVDLHRRDPRTGGILHRYMTAPSNIALILAYKPDSRGGVNRKTPLLLQVRQSRAVTVLKGGRSLKPVPDGPLQGRVLGDLGGGPKMAAWLEAWTQALQEYLAVCGLAEYGFVYQGCVLQYENGEERYIRNFSPNYGFKPKLLQNVTGIRRSPLATAILPLERLDSGAQSG